MTRDPTGQYIAILIAAVLVVIIGLMLANPPKAGTLQPCDYGITTNCEP